MSIHYNLTYLLLVGEVLTFIFVLVPMPYKVQKRIFTFLSKSPIVGKIVYCLKISFIFVGILFVDAVTRMWKATAELAAAKAHQGGAAGGAGSEASMHAKKFYAERNVYLTGFTLLISLALTRTFYIILDHINTQEEYAKLKTKYAGGVTDEEGQTTIKNLRGQLEAKDRDIETLKKQASQLSTEYDRVATELNKATGGTSDKRKD